MAPVRNAGMCDLRAPARADECAPKPRAPLLEARNVRKVFVGGGMLGRRRVVALEDISLAIDGDEPSVLAVAGESGSGKSTLARLLLGLLEPTSGEVLYRGRNIRRTSRESRRSFRRDVQAIFQDPLAACNPFYRVDHLLTTPLAKFGLAGSRAEAHELIAAALQAVGLRPEETLGRYPHQLSVGQLQRITIARALLVKPRLVIADEPVSMVDASLRATILAGLQKLHEEHGISLLYITHDLATAYQVSQAIVVLYQGVVAEAGDVEAVIGDPKHPYTRELVASVPEPDPKRRWAAPAAASGQRAAGRSAYGAQAGRGPDQAAEGCRYRPLCPRATPRCGEGLPPLYRLGPRRATACYLYEGSPTLRHEDLTAVLSRKDNPLSTQPTPDRDPTHPAERAELSGEGGEN